MLGARVTVAFASLLGVAHADASAPSLPRQFSVEVAPGGALFADGTRIGATSELARWAQRAASGARFAGAVVFGDPERDGPALAEAIDLLQKAGFADVRSAGRPAPAALSAARANGVAPVVSSARGVAPSRANGVAPVVSSARGVAPSRASASPSATAPNATAPSATAPSATSPNAMAPNAAAPVRAPAVAPSSTARPKSAPSGPPVSLASLGMHVDGLLNREPHRGRFLRLIEREFPAFKRCHARVAPHAQPASFGVDLLIGKDGGRAKIRETRTRLEGAGFESCMRGAFEAIRFPAPPSERPEIVSYSVVFKPGAR